MKRSRSDSSWRECGSGGLNTTRAFHSALVEPILDELEASLDGVAIQPPSLSVVSNLTGRAVEPGQTQDGAYWRRHAREPVAFAQGVKTMADLGVDAVLEIGPRSVLAPMAASSWPQSPQAPPPVVLSSLSPPSDDAAESRSPDGFVEAVAEAYQAGLPIRFEGLFSGETRETDLLPSYPFQRERHWIELPRRRPGGAGHPLLGSLHESARGETAFETEVFPSDPSWMNDHKVFGRTVAPGALYGAMACSASLLEESGPVVVEEMQLHNPLVFEEEEEEGNGEGRKIQVVIDAAEPASPRGLQIFSRGSEGGLDRSRGRSSGAGGIRPGSGWAGRSGKPQGRPVARGRGGLLPPQGEHRGRPRSVLPHPRERPGPARGRRWARFPCPKP